MKKGCVMELKGVDLTSVSRVKETVLLIFAYMQL